MHETHLINGTCSGQSKATNCAIRKCHQTSSPISAGLLPQSLLRSVTMHTVPAESPSCTVVVVGLWNGTLG